MKTMYLVASSGDNTKSYLEKLFYILENKDSTVTKVTLLRYIQTSTFHVLSCKSTGTILTGTPFYLQVPTNNKNIIKLTLTLK